jgi:hypothetical protein
LRKPAVWTLHCCVLILAVLAARADALAHPSTRNPRVPGTPGFAPSRRWPLWLALLGIIFVAEGLSKHLGLDSKS